MTGSADSEKGKSLTKVTPPPSPPSEYQWHEAINQFQPYVFRISTPDGYGTGFLLSRSRTKELCVVATAAHVVRQAHFWDQPIRLQHFGSKKAVKLQATERSISLDVQHDTAGILCDSGELELPDAPIPLMKPDYFVKPGVEIGWLGFPAIPLAELCFFSGRVSAYREDESRYLVDGVAINGVSGGPAFRIVVGHAELMGVVAAYIPNRATGEVLPGLAVVLDVTEYHGLADRFRSIDEAKAEEPPPAEPPPPPQSEPPSQGPEQGKST